MAGREVPCPSPSPAQPNLFPLPGAPSCARLRPAVGSCTQLSQPHLHQHGQRAAHAQVVGRHRLARAAAANHDAAQPLAHVGQAAAGWGVERGGWAAGSKAGWPCPRGRPCSSARPAPAMPAGQPQPPWLPQHPRTAPRPPGGHRQDGHDLGGHGNVKARLPRLPLLLRTSKSERARGGARVGSEWRGRRRRRAARPGPAAAHAPGGSRTCGPCPMVMPRRKRSLVSSTRRHVMAAAGAHRQEGRFGGGGRTRGGCGAGRLGRHPRQARQLRAATPTTALPSHSTTHRLRLPTAPTRCPLPAAPTHCAHPPGSMSRRTKRERSSGVSSFGSALEMPSLARRRSMTGAKRRPPFWSGGHSRLKSASVAGWGGRGVRQEGGCAGARNACHARLAAALASHRPSRPAACRAAASRRTVALRGLVEAARVDGGCQQVVGGGDGVDVARHVQVELVRVGGVRWVEAVGGGGG